MAGHDAAGWPTSPEVTREDVQSSWDAVGRIERMLEEQVIIIIGAGKGWLSWVLPFWMRFMPAVSGATLPTRSIASHLGDCARHM